MSTFEQSQQSGDKQTSPESTQEEREVMEIKDTGSFQRAVESGQLDEAAAWLEQVKSEPKYDARWLDHRSRELMRALCDADRLDEAERYINYAQSEEGRRGRQAKMNRLKSQSS